MNNNLWQKYGSHLILMILIGLFLIGAGAISAIEPPPQTNAGNNTTAVANNPNPNTNNNTPQNTPTTETLPTINLTNIPILSDNSLAPALNPNTFQGQRPNHNFTTYIVERGDAPASIAERFGISTETILGGNPQLSNEASLLQTDVELIILPIDGVLHTVQRGETLASISLQYGIPIEDITAYENNNLEFPYRLFPDTQLLIPGALPAEQFVWNPPTLSAVVGSSPEALNLPVFVTGSGSHIWPVNGRNITQGYWVGHQAIDIGLVEGTSVVASDRGTVTYAAWSVYCYGNLVVINHGNTGHETFYAHLNSIGVTPGQIVEKGQYIGSSGNTGCSSGPHLHYEIRIWQNRDNPFYYLP